MTVTREGNIDALREILCAGMDPNLVYKGQTLLMHACEVGHADMVTLLIENGAHVDKQDRYGRTALFMAARFGHLDCCKVLCAAGANDSLRAELLGGEDALLAARARGHLHITRFFLYEQNTVRGGAPTKTSPASHTKAVDATRNYHTIAPQAQINYGTRSIAAGGATGATTSGTYTEGVDAPPRRVAEDRAVPNPLPPPLAASAQPVRDETRRLAPQPRYTI